MLNLLTVCLESDKMQPVIYNPTPTTTGIQLNNATKGVIVDITEIEMGYCVKLLEMPAGQQNPKPILKAVSTFLNYGDTEYETPEWDLCQQIFDKYFGKDDQQKSADYAAQQLENKKASLSVAKNGK